MKKGSSIRRKKRSSKSSLNHSVNNKTVKIVKSQNNGKMKRVKNIKPKRKMSEYKINQYDSYSTNREGKQKRKKPSHGHRVLSVIVFLFLTIYLLGYLVAFVSKPSIPVETVSYGTIDVPTVLKGLIIRDEYVVKSTIAGNPTYYFSENERVKKDSVICKIKNKDSTSEIETKIAKIDKNIIQTQKSRGDISIFQDDIERIEKNINNTVDSYTYKFMNEEISNVYALKNQLESQITQRNQIWMTENTESLTQLSEERSQYQAQLDSSMTAVTAQESGILSFRIDGKEELLTTDKLSSITKEETTMKVTSEMISKSQSVKAEDPIFKIVRSNQWYLVSFIPIDMTAGWEVGDTKALFATIEEDEKIVQVTIDSIEPFEKESKVVFHTDKNLIDFIGERNIEYQIKDEIYQGIKIPNSAIVEKTLLKIPADCITESLGDSGVIKMVNSVGTFVKLKVTKIDSAEGFAYVLQDFQSLKIGDIVLKGSGETAVNYTVSEVQTNKGVYVVNSSVAEFTMIEVMGSNTDYSVVKPGTASYELQIYDNIVSDAKNVQESQEIF